MKNVLARPEHQAERPIDGQPQDTQRHIERTKDQGRPYDSAGFAAACAQPDCQQGDSPHHVQHVVPRVARAETRRESEPIQHEQPATLEQQPRPQDQDVESH